MLKNPYVTALLGGLVGGLTVAGPLVDDGVLASEGIAIALGALTGTGLVSLPNARQRTEAESVDLVDAFEPGLDDYEPAHRA